MSRSQEGAVVDTSKNQNATEFGNEENSYKLAQGDVGDYEKQLGDYAGQVAKFSSSNPYVQGGQFDTAEDAKLSNTSDAAAQAAGQVLQGQSLRTGQNTAGDVAATEDMQQQNTRDLSGEQAGATQQRIASEAGYNTTALGANQDLLSATAVPEQMEASLSSGQGQLAEGDLGIQQKAGETPSWMDDFGGAFAKSLGSGLGKVGS